MQRHRFKPVWVYADRRHSCMEDGMTGVVLPGAAYDPRQWIITDDQTGSVLQSGKSINMGSAKNSVRAWMSQFIAKRHAVRVMKKPSTPTVTRLSGHQTTIQPLRRAGSI